MQRLLAVLFLVILGIAIYGTITGQSYVVQMDGANNEVVRIIDGSTGQPVDKTLADLKAEGETYEIMYVQPRTMVN